MNWTAKLNEVLAWIASHASRLRHKNYEPPNHLAGALVYMLGEDGKPAQTFMDEEQAVLNSAPIVLNVEGQLSGLMVLPKQKVYRLEVRDRDGTILYTQDNIWAL